MKRENKKILLATAVGFSLVCSTASVGYCVYDYITDGKPITILSSGVDGNSTNFTEGSIADVVNKVSSSVVSIVTETRTTSWFGQSSTSTAAGTGMIVSADGYILTNKHVISGASNVSVILDNGTTYTDVTIVGTDPLNDVAFLKINNVSGLSPVTLGDSKTLNAGQQVVAIGNALGQFQNTVTSGIISGTGRSITASDGSSYYSYETLTDMIQTDAAINSGNSGGPLVNAAGEVIGMNTATSSTGDNIGFAIPISSIKGMLTQLLATGTVSRAYIGVRYINVTPDVAKSYDLPVTAGAYLYSDSAYTAIVSDGPASKAGLLDKDIITAINGVKIGSAGSLSTLLGEYKPSDTVQLTILRSGSEITKNVTIEAYPQN